MPCSPGWSGSALSAHLRVTLFWLQGHCRSTPQHPARVGRLVPSGAQLDPLSTRSARVQVLRWLAAVVVLPFERYEGGASDARTYGLLGRAVAIDRNPDRAQTIPSEQEKIALIVHRHSWYGGASDAIVLRNAGRAGDSASCRTGQLANRRASGHTIQLPAQPSLAHRSRLAVYVRRTSRDVADGLRGSTTRPNVQVVAHTQHVRPPRT